MIISEPTEDELALFALFMDESGVDQMEMTWLDHTNKKTGGLFRTWPVQFYWWRAEGKYICSAGSRSIGKTLSAIARCYAFPFVAAGEELVITAPDGDRLNALTDKVETVFSANWVAKAMLAPGLRGKIKHRPFHINFANNARIMGRIPRHDGTGMQGSCIAGTLILTRDRGLVPVEEVTTSDYVWSHKERWSKVVKSYKLPVQEAFEVKGQGAFPLTVNDDHRFYVRNDISKQPGKTKRNLGIYGWEYVNELTESKYGGVNSYWSSPNHFGEELPIPEINWNINSCEMNENFWWIVGRFLADGYTVQQNGNRGRIIIISHPNDHNEICGYLSKLDFNFHIKKRDHSSADAIEFCSQGLVNWLNDNFGKTAYQKSLPTWCLTMPREWREALLTGYLSGNGTEASHGTQTRMQASSVSKRLTLSIGMLGSTLGYHVGYSTNVPKTTHINGVELKNQPARRYMVRLNEKGDGYKDFTGFTGYKIRSVNQVEDSEFYGISVNDGSYFAEGVMHHNTHPLILIQDEASTYPERGWKETYETLKQDGEEGDVPDNAKWFSHGVTMGPGNTFDDIIEGKQPIWNVYKLPAMLRPTWSEKERQDKIVQYGGIESIDFKRNVYGSAEGADATLLNLPRLMSNCVDVDDYSDFNHSEYYTTTITDALLHEVDDILDLVDPPIQHTQYKKIWMGMDYGMTTSHSCILAFEEERHPKENHSRLKLVCRIMMVRIPTEDQIKVIMHLMNIYKPIALSFDAHGVGWPAYEWLQKEVREDDSVSWMLDRVKPYSFSEKIVVDFHDHIEFSTTKADDWKRAAIYRMTGDESLDALRLTVDTHSLWLPNDGEVLGELKAVPRKELMTMDEYGRPKRKKGGHVLDAFRFALLGWKLRDIEKLVAEYTTVTYEAPPMLIMDYF